MRDFQLPSRSVALGSSGMVATSNPQAAMAGLHVLRAGGNAVDAAVAMAAMLAVVEPTQTGIGGDCFALIKKPGQAPLAIDGAGWAPQASDPARLRDAGHDAIPPDSAAAVTVPGAVATWAQLVADHGTWPLGTLLAGAIDAAQDGYLVTERLSRDWGRAAAKISATAQGAAIFLPGGQAPAVGDRRANPKLANALRAIARDGADAFYRGWIAEDMVDFLRGRGGDHTLDDFADFRPRYVTPIATDYRGYRLWECPPSGQGLVALQIAGMLRQFDVSALDPLGAERFHLHAELSRLAYAQRDAFIADPSFASVEVDALLSHDHLHRLAQRFDPARRMADLSPAPGPEHRDTVYLSVVDGDGTVVSFINSIFDDFGGGLVAPESGVVLHNRGCGFVLEDGHPNVLAGRKRPMHTIIPALLTKDGEAVMAFGVTGGHFQPTGQMLVLSNIVDYGMSVQQAIDHPRVFARGDSLELERTVPDSVWQALRARGHAPTLAENPLGTSHAIWIDRQRGTYFGGSDGRRDGLAIGL